MENPERKLLLFLLLLPLLSVSCVSNPKSTGTNTILVSCEDLYVSKFLFPCVPSSVSWCVVSDAEEKKCLDLSGNATAHHIKGTLQCVRGLNSRDCMVRIKVAVRRTYAPLSMGPSLLQGRFIHGGFGGFPLRMGRQMQPPCLRMTSTPPASATAWSWLQGSPITEWVSLISAADDRPTSLCGYQSRSRVLT